MQRFSERGAVAQAGDGPLQRERRLEHLDTKPVIARYDELVVECPEGHVKEAAFTSHLDLLRVAEYNQWVSANSEFGGLFSGFGGGEASPDLRGYLREIGVDPSLFARTTAPGTLAFERLVEQGPYLPVPEDAAAGPAAYYGTYLDIREYVTEDILAGRAVLPEDLINEFIARFDRADMLICLAVLGYLSKPHLKLPELVTWYREQLHPNLRSGFDGALRRRAPGLGRLLVARQPVLASIRTVLQAAPSTLAPERPSLATAIMMTHALGATLDSADAPDEEMLERVMNLGENPIGMRILRSTRFLAIHRFPHSQAIAHRVHNSH